MLRKSIFIVICLLLSALLVALVNHWIDKDTLASVLAMICIILGTILLSRGIYLRLNHRKTMPNQKLFNEYILKGFYAVLVGIVGILGILGVLWW